MNKRRSFLNYQPKKYGDGGSTPSSKPPIVARKGEEQTEYVQTAKAIDEARTLLDAQLRAKLKLAPDAQIPDSAALSPSEVTKIAPDYYKRVGWMVDNYTKHGVSGLPTTGGKVQTLDGLNETGKSLEDTAYGPIHRSVRYSRVVDKPVSSELQKYGQGGPVIPTKAGYKDDVNKGDDDTEFDPRGDNAYEGSPYNDSMSTSPMRKLGPNDHPSEFAGQVIEVEGKELETENGKIKKDFNKQPSHEDGGYQYKAVPGRTIIPSKLRTRYLEGDKTTRNTIEANLVKDQVMREATKQYGKGGLTKFLKMRKGGAVPEYGWGGGIEGGLMGAGSGAMMGSQFDAMTGGADMGLGTALGAIAGGTMGAINGSKTEDAKAIAAHQMQLQMQNANQMPVNNDPMHYFEHGGKTGIHIKPSHRGRFTAYKERTGKTTEEALHSSDPHVRKMANFARNASHWSHKYADGGATPNVRRYDSGGGIMGSGVLGQDNNFAMADPNMDFYNNQAQTAYQNFTNPIDSMSGPSNNGSGNNSNSNFQSYANKAGQLAPMAYNTAMGLSKPTTLNPANFQNPYEGRVRSLMANRSINMTPIENGIRDTYNEGLSNVGNGTKSGGQVLSGATALWSGRMNALANARLKAQDANNGYRGEEAGTLGNLGAADAHTNLAINDINMRSQAATRSFMGQAAVEANHMSNANQYNDMMGNNLDDLYANESWNKGQRRFQYRQSN